MAVRNSLWLSLGRDDVMRAPTVDENLEYLMFFLLIKHKSMQIVSSMII